MLKQDRQIPYGTVEDVTIQNSLIIDAPGGVTITGMDATVPNHAGTGRRIISRMNSCSGGTAGAACQSG